MAIRRLACSRLKYAEARSVLTLMGVKIREVSFGNGNGPEVTVKIEHEALTEGSELMGLMFLPEAGAGTLIFRAVLTNLSTLIETAQAGAVAAHQVVPAPLPGLTAA